MRWVAIGLACLALAGCGKKAEDRATAPGDVTTGAAGVAFTYAYTFRLPSPRISAAQEAHAAACERLGAPRCRITGMNYRVDDGGDVNASLSVSLAAPIARAFGRQSIAAIESTGGTLIGADIGGADAAPAAQRAEGDRAAAAADQRDAKAALARPGLPPAERAAQIDRKASADADARAAATAKADALASVAFTPMTFAYQPGSGVGVGARLGDAGHTATASLAFTLSAALTLLAVLGPPAVLALLLFLLWRWAVRRWWRRLVGPSEPI